MSTIENYRKMLLVNRHRLDEELELQPEVMMRIASEVTLRNSRMIESKDELARTEARLYDQLQQERESRVTVEAAKNAIVRHRDRITAFERWQAARAEHEDWSALLEAWRQRGFSMNKLTELYADQYWTKDSAGMSDRQRARHDESDGRRAEMRRQVHQPLAREREEAEQPRSRRSL